MADSITIAGTTVHVGDRINTVGFGFRTTKVNPIGGDVTAISGDDVTLALSATCAFDSFYPRPRAIGSAYTVRASDVEWVDVYWRAADHR